jgi:hypothetical protein
MEELPRQPLEKSQFRPFYVQFKPDTQALPFGLGLSKTDVKKASNPFLEKRIEELAPQLPRSVRGYFPFLIRGIDDFPILSSAFAPSPRPQALEQGSKLLGCQGRLKPAIAFSGWRFQNLDGVSIPFEPYLDEEIFKLHLPSLRVQTA